MAAAPLRGQVWTCALPPPLGPHPVVILTVNHVATPLSAVTVAVITGTDGPRQTHVPIGSDAGLRRYAESYVNCTDLHTVRKLQLRRLLGYLSAAELATLAERIRLILGLD